MAMLARRRRDFDAVHDNQCLGYGLLGVPVLGLPLLATVHHPVAIDRDLEVAYATAERRPEKLRWYRFVAMQRRVAGRLDRIITPSRAAKAAIIEHLRVPGERVDVVPVGVDHAVFRPDPVVPRVAGRIVSIASADVPIKGLDTLIAAAHRLHETGQRFELIVVGRPRADTVAALAGHPGLVSFRTNLSDVELADLLRSVEIACVPSRYEGFSMPAGIAGAAGFTWRRCAEATVAGYLRSVSAC
ncbi:MAG TPA: glycosyltransferase [Pseudonocardiaceae bacterium]